MTETLVVPGAIAFAPRMSESLQRTPTHVAFPEMIFQDIARRGRHAPKEMRHISDKHLHCMLGHDAHK